MLRSAIIAAVVMTAGTAYADGAGSDDFDVILPAAPTYRANDVQIDEHLGARLPLDTPFRTSDGALVTLGEVLRGDLPTILTFNYSDCPMLCSLQLNGLTAALPQVAVGSPPMQLGQQFRIVTIDLEPNEPLDKLQRMKARYIERATSGTLGAALDTKAAIAGWTFLAAATPGVDASIRRVANAVGFKYAYVTERAEWAHPAALIFVSSAGAVTRYIYGIEYPTPIMRESIFKAGMSEPASTVGFMNRCYHYDPDANSHAREGVLVMRYGAAGFIVLLLGAVGIIHLVRKHSRSHGAMS